MSILGFEFEEIATLLRLVEAQGLDELVVQEGDQVIRIRGWQSEPQPATLPTRAQPQAARVSRRASSASGAPTVPAADATAPAEDQITLVSPMVGVFYRTEKPGAPPLIDIGDRISVGQTIGILESMKIFSEIPAEHAGVVVAIPARDGELVQSGSVLVVLKQDELL